LLCDPLNNSHIIPITKPTDAELHFLFKVLGLTKQEFPVIPVHDPAVFLKGYNIGEIVHTNIITEHCGIVNGYAVIKDKTNTSHKADLD